jgi:hypothetical protein
LTRGRNQSIREKSKYFRYLTLKRGTSLEFCEKISFRNKCLSLINNASSQLNLNLSGRVQLTDVSALGHVPTLDLSYCDQLRDVSALGHAHTLNLRGCGQITDVSALGYVHTLNMSGCRQLRDVSALGHVHASDLSECAYFRFE